MLSAAENIVIALNLIVIHRRFDVLRANVPYIDWCIYKRWMGGDVIYIMCSVPT